jgi:DUF971 family protein
MTTVAAPLSLVLEPHALIVQWHDGPSSVPAARLRASCRCAPCQSARLRGGPASPDVAPTLVDALPVGHYAIQLRFSDGHDRGIYPWAFLRELAGDLTADA